MFERFHRVKHARARTHEGTGIGLALVQELARLHGGTVSVSSEEGRGTTFVVAIRTGRSHLPAERIGAARQLTSTSVGAMPYVEEALRWLPASDASREIGSDVEVPQRAAVPANAGTDSRSPTTTPTCASTSTRILGQSYRVEAVGDGRAALDRIAVDAARSDPERRDDAGARRLRPAGRHPRERAGAIRAGDSVVGTRRRGGPHRRAAAGADDYLVKPFTARELLASVASQLQLARLRRESEAERMRLLKENADVTATLNEVGALVSSDLDRNEIGPGGDRCRHRTDHGRIRRVLLQRHQRVRRVVHALHDLRRAA